MANKTFQGRIVQKHDTEANWKKATNFIPLKGEIIIYDDLNKIKIGDGTTKINDLDFSTVNPSDMELVDLATVATSGDYNDLSNKPTIPSVGNGTLTIQKNGTTVDTFTANATTNKTINITVPTKVSELTNDKNYLTSHQDISGKVDKVTGKGLSTNDLTDTLKSNYDAAYTHSQSTHAPTDAEHNIIVGIQKNGSDLTINSSTRKVNITVPTKVSELTDDVIDGHYLPLTGGTMTGDINANNNNITNIRTFQLYTGDATPSLQFSGECSNNTNYLSLIDTAGNGIIVQNILTPEADTDAANKKYVDDQIAANDHTINRFTFTATAGQSTFTIPFDFEDSSALTVYYNGIMMKETDNYTISGKVITLVDFIAEIGDYLTVMGIEGATAIDFGSEAADAIAEMKKAKEDAIKEIKDLVATLPSDTTSLMFLNKTNTMTADGKITMASSYIPSNAYDVATKVYADNATPTFSSTQAGKVPASGGGTSKYLRADGTWSELTPAVGTTTNYAIYIGSTAPASGTTPLLWIDTTASTGTFKYRTSTTGTWTAVPVAWS